SASPWFLLSGRSRVLCPALLDSQRDERLLRRLLLGRLLRLPASDADLVAVDDRRAGEPPVVGRALDFEHRVGDRLAAPRERLLQLRLVVDVRRERVLDPRLERGDDRLLDLLEAVLEEERCKRGLEQRSKDVPVLREALELVRRDVGATLEQTLAEVELPRDDRAALTRDDVGTNLREPPLGEVRVPVVEGPRDRELEHAVAEELEPLVGRGRGRRPTGMRVDLLRARLREALDRPAELVHRRGRSATGATRRSRQPGRRSGSSARPRPRS